MVKSLLISTLLFNSILFNSQLMENLKRILNTMYLFMFYDFIHPFRALYFNRTILDLFIIELFVLKFVILNI